MTVTAALWAAIFAVGFVLRVWNWYDDRLDVRATTQESRETGWTSELRSMRRMARFHSIVDALGAFASCFFLMSALAASFIGDPPPPRPDTDVNALRTAVTVACLLIAGVIFNVMPLVSRYERHSTIGELRRKHIAKEVR